MLHPSKFFEWCAIRIGIDVFELFNNDLKYKLMNIHPRNFIKSKLDIPIYKVSVGYETEKGNYTVMNTPESIEVFVRRWMKITEHEIVVSVI